MGHKLFTACGCGVESKKPVSHADGNTPDHRAQRIVIGFIARRQSDCNYMGGNLNAYNVLKQEGIAKPEDYSNIKFPFSIYDQLSEKPLAYHANKKASDV